MLQITIAAIELYDETNNEFVSSKEQGFQIEHSLVSLSKWESKWCKPFISKAEKTHAEFIDYVRCMTITQNVNNDVYNLLTSQHIKEINQYIELPMTATIFASEEKSTNREIITAEIIYYWMVAMNIPFECQKWHLNRLLTLINVCNLKNKKPTKMSKRELIARNRSLNESRRNNLNTKG